MERSAASVMSSTGGREYIDERLFVEEPARKEASGVVRKEAGGIACEEE